MRECMQEYMREYMREYRREGFGNTNARQAAGKLCGLVGIFFHVSMHFIREGVDLRHSQNLMFYQV